MYSCLAIANEFIKRAFEEGIPMTHMKLQKLVYFAHGWNLAVNGRELIEEEFEAWEYGPVVRKLFDALGDYGTKEIKNYIKWADDTPYFDEKFGIAKEDLDEKELAVIDQVWKGYKNFEAFQLSKETHKSGTPWARTYQKGKNKKIDTNLIWDHFADLAERPEAA